MDISSNYFSHFKKGHFRSFKHLWGFLYDAYRVGKLSELFSFILWETYHRIGFYSLTNQYVSFIDKPYLSLIKENDNLNDNSEDSLGNQEWSIYFKSVAVDWNFCVESTDGALWGPRFSNPNGLYKSIDQSQSAVLIQEFSHPISSLFITQQNILFVCVSGILYRQYTENTFRIVLQLSTPISYFLFNNGMTELPDHTLIVGEYGSIWQGKKWKNLAFLYYSSDEGVTWHKSDFLIRQGVNKHIHLVKYCHLLNSLILTDGDNLKKLWINKSLLQLDDKASKSKNGWQLVNNFHFQTGGYLSMAETNESVLFGSDYLGGTNFIVRTTNGKQFEKLVLPDPYRRSPVMNMVQYQSESGSEIWAVSYSCLSTDAKSLLMYSKDSGKTWTRVLEFDGTQYLVRLMSTYAKHTHKLYVSISKYASDQSHQHWVYQLVDHSGCV